MKVDELIKQKRTIRLFKQEKIDYEILERCVDAARLSASARNSQPLEYIIIDDPEKLKQLVPLLYFGGGISEDKQAKKGYEPTAVIIIIAKKGYEDYCPYDVGIASQNIALVAFENRIGTCMMGAIKKDKIKELLNVPDDYYVDLAVSMGYPAEQPIIEEPETTDSETKYNYRREDELYIPKRKLNDVLHKNEF